jgi:peptidoglycan/LPS O-acetylase OafA/YrhL
MAANTLPLSLIPVQLEIEAETSNTTSLQQIIASRKIASLNGIRAVAALLVVLYHLGCSPIPGNYGVVTFFVLSGFLITNRLMHESKKTGTVALRAFYWRRAIRLLPAFYAFAAVYLISRLLAHSPIDWPQVLASFAYLGDYYMAIVRPAKPVMTHTWSLAIEEQFYLVWPFVFVVCRNRLGWLTKAVFAAMGMASAYRAVLSLHGTSPDYLYYAFDTRLDSLLIGCFLALAIHHGKRFRVLMWSPLVGAIALAAIASLQYLNSFLRGLPFDFNAVVLNGLLTVLCAALILNAVWFAEHPVYRWLNNPAMDGLGVLSYSIYLYHPLLVKAVAGLSMMAKVPACLVGSIIAAHVSYMFVERPFLKLRNARLIFRLFSRDWFCSRFLQC